MTVFPLRAHKPHTPPATIPSENALLPKVSISDDFLCCDGRIVSLYGKRLTAELVRIFVTSPTGLLSRDELVAKLYNIDPADRSRSFMNARRASMLKLISRSRQVLHAGLIGSPGEWIEWFSYHIDAREYELFRIRNQYMHAKLRHLHQFELRKLEMEAQKRAKESGADAAPGE